MAKGTAESEEFVLRSGPRFGLKREFAFALKSHSQFSETIGRTRSGKKRQRLSPKLSAKEEDSRLGPPVIDVDGDAAGVACSVPVEDGAGGADGEVIMEEDPRSGISAAEGCVDGSHIAGRVGMEDHGACEDSAVNSVAEIGRREDGCAVPVSLSEKDTVVRSADNAVCRVEGDCASQFCPRGKSLENEPVDMELGETEVAEKVYGAKEIFVEVEIIEKTSVAIEAVEAVHNRSPESEIVDGASEDAQISPSRVHGTTVVEGKSEAEANADATPRFSDEKADESAAAVNGDPSVAIAINGDQSSTIRSVLPALPRRVTRSMVKETAKPGESVATTIVEDVSILDSSKSEGACETGETKSTNEVNQMNSASSKKLELKMSKKIVLDKFPSTIKELFGTGLLEGLPVRYLDKNGELHGTIRGFGIMCSCSICNWTKVISPYQFEKHAGSLKKRSAEYIYLENGKTIRDVLNACSNAHLDMLEATIQGAICSSPIEQTHTCQNCKRHIKISDVRKSMLLCPSCLGLKRSEASTNRVSTVATVLSKQVIIPKSPTSASKHVSLPKKSVQGRVTKKDLGLHKLVFSQDGLPDGTEVAYYARGQRLLEGYKTGNGIFCHCCNSEVSPSQFEAHAGWASRRKPYLNIYTSNGVSLHELSLSLSQGRKHSTTDSDDLCSICFDGGNLLLCDLCPRAFHTDCVGLSSVPRGKWYCTYCENMLQREKFVEHNLNAIAAGRVSGVDPIEQISKRSIRIVKVKTSEADVSCCVLCKRHDFSKSGFGPRTVLLCDQCEKEYHVGCLKEHNMGDLKELPKGNWFCCANCSEIHATLENLILNGPESLPDPLLHVINAKVENSSKHADCDVRWRLLRGKFASPETRLLLSKAVGLFHDRFDPIVDSTTGRDLIPSMVYGRNMRDQEFGGMYCAVLTVNSSVVSAGILRIFGQDVAELPLVATRIEYQGQGYFQSLFSCIERLLGLLNVKNLVLPAADQAESIWTSKFGFNKISQEQLVVYSKESRLMTFQGTSMLHKAVPRTEVINSDEGS